MAALEMARITPWLNSSIVGRQVVFLITKILWDQIHTIRCGDFEVGLIQRLNSQRDPVRAPSKVGFTDWSGDNHRFSPKPQETTESPIPAGFIDGSLGVKSFSKTKQQFSLDARPVGRLLRKV